MSTDADSDNDFKPKTKVNQNDQAALKAQIDEVCAGVNWVQHDTPSLERNAPGLQSFELLRKSRRFNADHRQE